MASILTFSLAFYLAFFVPYVLAYVLACYLAFYLTFFSGVLSGISSEILCGRGLAGNTLIRSLRWRPSGEHCDREVAIGVRWGGTLRSIELAVEVRRGAEEGVRKEEGGRKEEASSLT